jgi:hypothetical protein
VLPTGNRFLSADNAQDTHGSAKSKRQLAQKISVDKNRIHHAEPAHGVGKPPEKANCCFLIGYCTNIVQTFGKQN